MLIVKKGRTNFIFWRVDRALTSLWGVTWVKYDFHCILQFNFGHRHFAIQVLRVPMPFLDLYYDK